MLQKRTEAFEEVVVDLDERQQARLEQAHALLNDQADALMVTEAGEPDLTEARHAPYNPHHRPLSAAARRLVRAHQRVQDANQE